MAYAEFYNDEYMYLSDRKYLLFSADNTHNYLFDYIDADLSRLPCLLERYISDRIDTTTFEITDRYTETAEITDIKEILISAHPYYVHEWKKIIMQAIGEYFNALLLYSGYQTRTLSPDLIGNACHSEKFEKWYKDRITVLLAPLLTSDDTFPTDFYHTFIRQTYGNTYMGRTPDSETEDFILNVPQHEPHGFDRELQTQKTASNMLYIILDILAPKLENLSLQQRKWIYDNISGMAYPQSEFSILMQQSSCRPAVFHDENRSAEATQANELANTFQPLYALNNINIERNGFPADLADSLSSAIQLAKTLQPIEIFTTYQIDSLQALLYLEIMAMIQKGTMIRKCRRCNKYFMVYNRKVAYCNRINESGLRCSDIGSQESYKKKLNTDEALKIYTRAYKTHYARIKKGNMSQAAFQLWCDEAKAKLTMVRTGELDITTFQSWLKK